MAIGLYRPKEDPDYLNLEEQKRKIREAANHIPAPSAEYQPKIQRNASDYLGGVPHVELKEKKKALQINAPDMSIDRNMPEDQVHLPIDELQERIKNAKTRDRNISIPNMEYNPEQYLPENTDYLKSGEAANIGESIKSDEDDKDDGYKIDTSDVLKSVYDDVELPDMQGYDDERQKLRRNQAVLNTVGNALTHIGDGVTLGLGGYVVPRNFNDNEKYINDYLNYRDTYQKRLDEWNNQQYLNELKKAQGIVSEDQGNKRIAQGDRGLDQADRRIAQGDEQLKQGDKRLDIQQKANEQDDVYRNKKLGIDDANQDFSNMTSRLNAMTNKERLEFARKSWEKEHGSLDPVKVRVRTSAGIGEVEVTPNDYANTLPQAMSDELYMANSGMFEEKPAEFNQFGEQVSKPTFIPKKGVNNDMIVADYKKNVIEKKAPEWAETTSDYSTAGSSKLEIPSPIENEVQGLRYEYNPEYDKGRIASQGHNASLAEKRMREELNKQGKSEQEISETIDAIKKGKVSDKYTLNHTQNMQIERLLSRIERGEDPAMVERGIETVLRAGGVPSNEARIMAKDITQSGLPENVSQLPSEEERLNVLP